MKRKLEIKDYNEYEPYNKKSKIDIPIIENGNMYFKRDKNLIFDDSINEITKEKNHQYIVNDKIYMGVSTLKELFFGKFDADKIISYYRKPYYNGFYKNKSDTEIKTYWDKRKNDGTDLHDHIEEFYKKGIDIIDEKHYHYNDFTNFKSYDKKLDKLGYTKKISEKRVYSEKYELAGTIDLLVLKVDELNDDVCYKMIDWKRCRSPFYSSNSNIKKPDNYLFNYFPFEGLQKSVHLEHSFQLYTYDKLFYKHYNTLKYPYKNRTLGNVYFNDAYDDCFYREAIDIKKKVNEAFDLIFKYKEQHKNKSQWWII